MPHVVAHVEGDLDDAVHVGFVVVLDGQVAFLSVGDLPPRPFAAGEDFLDAAIYRAGGLG